MTIRAKMATTMFISSFLEYMSTSKHGDDKKIGKVFGASIAQGKQIDLMPTNCQIAWHEYVQNIVNDYLASNPLEFGVEDEKAESLG